MLKVSIEREREAPVCEHGLHAGCNGREKAYIPDMLPFSCFFRCLSRLVCWPKHLSHKWHLNGFSLLWMLRTCLCRLEDMLKDLSQYLHLKTKQNRWVENHLLVAKYVSFALGDTKYLPRSASVPKLSSLVPTVARPSLNWRSVLAEWLESCALGMETSLLQLVFSFNSH